MNEHALMIAVAAVLLGFGLVSRRAERGIVTPPMVFVALGLAVGGWGLDWLALGLDDPFLDGLGKLALILVLFTDASRIDLQSLRAEASLPARLLAIGLPLTILAGVLLAFGILSELSTWEALVLAAILAPTDAALGQAVVSSPLVPQRIRQTLNVESGLNDGIALPIVLLAVSLAGMMGEGGDTAYWLGFAALQIGLGPVVGTLAGWGGGRLVSMARAGEWMSPAFEQLAALGLSVLAFAGAELVGGNGFIAAFVCGLVLGNTAPEVCDSIHEFGEAEGQLLTLMVFLLFGAVIVPGVLDGFEPRYLLYALGSLTVVRMVPVALSLVGSGLWNSTVGFIGWFGPRGLASILYMLIVIEEGHVPGRETIEAVVAWTVLMSTFLHGVSAYPLASAYGLLIARDRSAAEGEMASAIDCPVRIRFHQGEL